MMQQTDAIKVTKVNDKAIIELSPPQHDTNNKPNHKYDETKPSKETNVREMARTNLEVSEDNVVQFKLTGAEGAKVFQPAFSATYASALHQAFAEHAPLILTPDQLHILIVQGVARVIVLYAESFRSVLVDFIGQQELILRHDRLMITAAPEQWDAVLSGFARMISEKSTNHTFVAAIMQRYSQSKDIDQQIKAITLMGTFSPFYSYTVSTRCFIPKFILEGSEQDWLKLASLPDQIISALKLTSDNPDPGHQKFFEWMDGLKIVLTEMVNARQGNANDKFWRSFYKYGSVSGGDQLTGYFNYFYPILRNIDTTADNKFVFNESLAKLRSNPGYGYGPHVSRLPNNLIYVPLKWDNQGTTYQMALKAGFFAPVKDRQDQISVCRGWTLFYTEKAPAGHKPKNLKKPVGAVPLEQAPGTLTMDHINLALDNYATYKDTLIWPMSVIWSNSDSDKATNDLKAASSDKERYMIATNFINRIPRNDDGQPQNKFAEILEDVIKNYGLSLPAERKGPTI